ncbi:YlmH/Sll1252 family protein [Aquibacillus albus]|uniref:YlmH/Sll1252 family protein n=1 Tax=Aquibacillus albus TaxID=1168171 RepID=UPI00195E5655
MDLYQHFRKEEHPFIDQVLSWREQVERSFQSKLSDFLNPREQKIFSTIIGKSTDYQLGFFGGAKNAERKRAILAPYYEEISDEDYEITLLEAKYPSKFITLEHRDVLGAFLSLGIKRKKLGELIVRDGFIQIVVASDIDMYIKVNLTEIKRASVTFEERPITNIVEKNEEWDAHLVTVSSLRLDAVLKEIYHISRQNASAYIEKGWVKVNFETIQNPSFVLEQDDLLSLRGKGRSKITDIHGLSKKEKWKITIEKLK